MRRRRPHPERIADRSTGINLVPVDLVVSSAVEIAAADTRAHHFHLTNSDTALVCDAIPIVCQIFGLPDPTFTDDATRLNAIDRRLNRYLDFYLPYLGGERIFDRSNVDAVVGPRLDFDTGPVLQRALVQTWFDERVAEATSSRVG